MTRKRPDHGTPPAPDGPRLLHEDLTREVIGGGYTVYNTLGFGFLESVYSRALYIELRKRGLRVEREVAAVVFYDQYKVGRFIVDQLVEGVLTVELKAGRALAPDDRQQLLNWLKSSKLELGLLFHFGPRPAFHRVISENAPFDPAVSASSAES